MKKTENFLLPSWLKENKDIICGFSLPFLGNQALTRKSWSTGKSIKENRLKLAEHLGVKLDQFFSPHQIHSDRIIIVNKENIGMGAFSTENAIKGDACITSLTDVLLLVTWADCVPVLLFDSSSEWIGAIHCGWKSAAKNILEKTISLLIEQGVNISNLFAAVGPGIGGCCYRVGREVNDAFKGSIFFNYFIEKKDGLFFDLSKGVYNELLRLGIKRNNIDFSGKCTCCSTKPSFFSCRKDGEIFEGQAAFIGKFSFSKRK